MSDRTRHTETGVCGCLRCMLTGCGALDASWPGWAEARLAGEIRVIAYLLVRCEPLIYPDAIGEWAGCIPWLDRVGVGLEFDEDAS
jgi:hypothetical protein